MVTIKIIDSAGSFAENKDIAKRIRNSILRPALKKNDEEIIVDFEGVTGATQSFVHALISQLIRESGEEFFKRVLFKDCNAATEEVINIVADYMAES